MTGELDADALAAAMARLDAARASEDAERRYRLDRRIAARGRHWQGRAHPELERPTDEQLGGELAKLRARCGECGERALGQFVRRERGVIWEHGGDRWSLDTVWSSNFLCRNHGLLSYHRDWLEADLDDAAQRRDQTKVRRLPPGPAQPPTRRRAGPR